MTKGSHWGLGALTSISFHAALAVAATALFVSRPVPQGPSPDHRLDIAALDVPQQSASQSPQHADRAAEPPTSSSAIGQGPISSSHAIAAPVRADTAASPQATGTSAASPTPDAQFLESRIGNAHRLTALQSAAPHLSSVQPDVPATATDRPVGEPAPRLEIHGSPTPEAQVALFDNRPLTPESVALTGLAPRVETARFGITDTPRLIANTAAPQPLYPGPDRGRPTVRRHAAAPANATCQTAGGNHRARHA